MCCQMLMARAHTRAYDVLALRHGYHGGGDATAGLTAQSTWKFEVPQARAGAGLAPHAALTSLPHPARHCRACPGNP